MTIQPHTQSQVIIIGGGLSGLSAAVYLARAGHTVTLFEKAGTLGGRARTRERNGFFFNQGAHAFRLHRQSEQVLNELGVSFSGSGPFSGAFGLVDEEIRPLSTVMASPEMLRFFERVKHLNIEETHKISLQEWLDQEVQHPLVRQFMLTRASIATLTNAPELLSAGLVLSLLNTQVLYLDNGWQTLVDGLRHKAQEAGVHLITQAKVRAIEVLAEGYRVRLEDDSHHEASAVLLATDPETASALVADGTHEALSQWAAQAIPVYVACLDIALRRLPVAENLVTFCMGRPFYYAVHSAAAHLAPEGSALVHLMKYLRPGEAAEPEATRQDLEGLMDFLQPGWRAEVVAQTFLPHIIASNAIVQARYGGLSGRPGPEVPGLPNLYVAGDWVGPEGDKADASFASARSAARLMIEKRRSRQSAALVSSSDVLE